MREKILGNKGIVSPNMILLFIIMTIMVILDGCFEKGVFGRNILMNEKLFVNLHVYCKKV